MKSRLPKVTLIWIYEGTHIEARRATVEALDYPDFDVLSAHEVRTLADLASRVREDTEVCVFWADDEKPISPLFLREMVQPLESAVLHLWSGNALSMPRGALQAVREADFVFKGDAFMKLTVLFLDASVGTPENRAHVAFSSTERLAPMCAEPMGMVC